MALSFGKKHSDSTEAKIGFIGAGRMATQMIDGLIASGIYNRDEIVACAPTKESRNKLCQNSGIQVYETANEISELTDVIVLACKPKNIPDLFEKEKLTLNSKKLLISIAAGTKISTLEKYAPEARIIRVMPNHCCLVFECASGYAAGTRCTDEDKKTVKKILDQIGLSVEVTENNLDQVTGISGSSPAFIYMLARGLAEQGIKQGLDEKQAVALVSQSLIGSGCMIMGSGKSIDELIDGVCSPGGTTIEGCKVLEKNNFEEIVKDCVDATVSRSKEMSKE